MRILFCGDIVGRSGRQALHDHLDSVRRRLDLDFVIVNGENAAHGFGITQAICREFYDLGVDVITTGNHAWDQREIVAYIDSDPHLLRPLNYLPGTPGQGAGIYTTARGRRILVANVMCRLFMELLDDPFGAVETLLRQHSLGHTVDAIVIDVHGEATSEKMAMGHNVDGRVSLLVGTHTHVPTADEQILPGGTAYQTDAGMCGDYDSVIGMGKATALARFRRKIVAERLQPADGEATLCALFVETDDRTGLATRVEPVRLGGRLRPHMPVPTARSQAQLATADKAT